MTKNKAFKICFKEFSGEVKEKKLGEVCIIGDINHQMPPSVLNGIPYLMTGDFMDNNGLDFKNCKFISNEDYEELAKKIKPEIGDILFARYASVGDVRYVETKIKFLISYSCAIIKCNKDIVGRYLFYYLQSNRMQYQIEINVNTGSQRNIGIDSLKKLIIFLPKIEEQTKTGNYFKNLDKLIEQKEKKQQTLKQLKKAMLSKMFPKEGADVPEIRFDGFCGVWVESLTTELCSISTGKNNTQDKIDNGKYPFYVRSAIIEKSDKYLFNEEAVLTVGDGVGTGKVYHYVNGKYNLHQRVYRMFDFQGVLGRYFYHYFSNNFYQRVMTMTAKTSVDSVRLDMIAHMLIKYPNIKEQKMISLFLDNLDNLIDLQQKELEKLKNIKKASLDKMFV